MEKTIRVNGAEFILVEAESLSLEDDFMQFEPHTGMEKVTKELLSEAIHNGVKNFYRPKCDPSFSADGESIRFVFGRKPATGKSYGWWERKAKQFCPGRNSRLGTRIEYGAFLGVLIKKLVEHGWEVADAWNAVCNDSRELGHYWNSEGASHNWEPTGFRVIHGYGDLANFCKLLAEDKEVGGFWEASGDYLSPSDYCPIAFLRLRHNKYRFNSHDGSVGWIVCKK